MKKVLSIIAVATVVTFASCGQSAEEKAKAEERAKAYADSVTKALEAAVNEANATSTEAVAEDTTAAPVEAAPAEEAK